MNDHGRLIRRVPSTGAAKQVWGSLCLKASRSVAVIVWSHILRASHVILTQRLVRSDPWQHLTAIVDDI